MADKDDYQSVVKFIRIKGSGDDLLTEAVECKAHNPEIREHFWTLMNPLKIVYMTNPNTGGFGVGLINWVSHVFSEEQSFNIKDEDILIIADVSKDMANNYFNTLNEVKQSIESIGNTFEAAEEEGDEWLDAHYDKKHYH